VQKFKRWTKHDLITLERKLHIWPKPNLPLYSLWRSLHWVDELMALSKVRRIKNCYHRLHFLPSESSYFTVTRKYLYLQILFQVSGLDMIEFNENSPIEKQITIMWLCLWDSNPVPEEMWQIPVGTKWFWYVVRYTWYEKGKNFDISRSEKNMEMQESIA